MSASSSGAVASSSSPHGIKPVDSMNPRDSGESSRRSEPVSDDRPSLEVPTGNVSVGGRLPSSGSFSARRSGEHDSGSFRSKRRGGGGFLLADSFGMTRKADPHTHGQRSTSDGKGKSKAVDEPLKVFKRKPTNGRGGINGSIRSSPLSRITAAASDGQDSRSSTEVDSANYGPTSGENGTQLPEDTEENLSRPSEDTTALQGPGPAVGSIDPAQIVNMALSLSESRRRNLSAGQLPSQAISGRRVPSTGSAMASPPMQGGYQNYSPGGSLRQYLNQQRRISRTISPGNVNRKTSGARHTSTSYFPSPQVDPMGSPEPAVAPTFNFSAATLARAEKAKQYMDLSMAHLHLLEFLPPLKPDYTAPGNSVYSASSIPGTAGFDLNRVQSSTNEKFPLGRQYNPLQLIRNRKLRARNRKVLNPGTEEFENMVEVCEWVAAVEESSKDPKYRGEDRVILPTYPLGSDPTAGEAQDESQTGHHRNASLASIRKRPRTDWLFSPAELLAEAYWLEQGDNKQLIENKYGNKIFPSKQKAEAYHPRLSYDDKRSEFSMQISGSSHNGDDADRESERHIERGRRRHPVHVDTGHKLRHALNKARGRSPSPSSDLSTSDREGGQYAKQPRLPLITSIDVDNVGPLQRHMENITGAETPESVHIEPMHVSPGTPNKWGTGHRFNHFSQSPDGLTREDRVHLSETVATDWEQHHSQSPERHIIHHRNIADADEPRSSTEEPSSTKPNSPVAEQFFPGIGSDLTPPSPRNSKHNRTQKSRLGILPFIKSDSFKDGRKHAVHVPLTEDGFAERRSRQPSVEEAPPRSSFESMTGSEQGKKLFSHKTNESITSINARPASRGKDAKDIKEPESAMRRFFKGGRIGEIVRAEGARLGDVIRKRDTSQSLLEEDSDSSEVAVEELDSDEDLDSVSAKPSETLNRITTASTSSQPISPLRSDRYKPRFHLDNLPTFKSSTTKTSSEPSRPSTPTQDHITTQQRLLRQINRSPRLDRLAPPSLDTSRVTSHSSTASPGTHITRMYTTGSHDSRRSSYGFPHLFHTRSRSRLGKRLTAILDVPGQVGRGGMPPTALASLQPERRASPSRPPLSDKRQWSISDAAAAAAHARGRATAVSAADIARVRALLLCSGVKAAALHSRAARPRRGGPGAVLARAGRDARRPADLAGVPLRAEFAVAGRLGADAVDAQVEALHGGARAFKEGGVARLGLRVADLRGVVESCDERTRAMGDRAVGFGAEVTGQRAMEVRGVMEALDKLVRARRRRLRWLRRIGFGLLEWVVLLFMWWVWFVVVVIKMGWNVLRGLGFALRWIFWLD